MKTDLSTQTALTIESQLTVMSLSDPQAVWYLQGQGEKFPYRACGYTEDILLCDITFDFWVF